VGAKTKEVGGGANVGTSNMWNNFLQQQMGGGMAVPNAPQMGGGGNSMTMSAPKPSMMVGGVGGGASGLIAGVNQQRMNQQQQQQQGVANQQAQNGFGNIGNLVNQLSNPNMQQQVDSNPFFQQMMGIQMPGQPQLGQYNTDAPVSDILGRVMGMPGVPGFLPQSGQQQGIDKIDFNQFQNMINGGGGFGPMGREADIFGPEATGGLLNVDMNSPEFQALKQQQAQDTALGLANTRARFGAGGGMSLGSGAALAEAQFNRQVLPANMLAQGDLARSIQELDMGNRGLNANVLLQQRGQNVDQRGQDTQAGIAGAQLGAQNNAALLNAMLGQQSNQLGAFNSANQFNSNMLGQMFGAAGGDAANALNAFNSSNQAVGAGNADLLNLFGMNSNNALNQQQLFGGLGQNMAGMNQQGQLGVLNNLFNSMNQGNQLGTAQRQNVVQPSAAGQTLGALGGIFGSLAGGPGGAALMNWLGGMFGGGGQGMGAGPGIGGGGFQNPFQAGTFTNMIPQAPRF
jgi:hypothetical protein